MKADYFKTAKRAAIKKLKETGDTSAAHRVAVESLRRDVPWKAEAFYGDMAWQCVLSAKGAV